jgi:hypothetical protein
VAARKVCDRRAHHAPIEDVPEENRAQHFPLRVIADAVEEMPGNIGIAEDHPDEITAGLRFHRRKAESFKQPKPMLQPIGPGRTGLLDSHVEAGQYDVTESVHLWFIAWLF